MGRTSRREFMRGGIALAGLGLLAAGGFAERTATAARAGQAAGERSIRAAAALQPLDPAVVLRVGRVGLLAEAGQVIAFERGYFQEEGIRVEYSDFDSAARMVPSLGAGQLEWGAGRSARACSTPWRAG